MRLFRKFGLIFFRKQNSIFLQRTSTPFPCYIHHSTANNAEVINKYAIFRKFSQELLKHCFLKTLIHFLLEDAKPFHLTYKLLFYFQKYFCIVVLQVVLGRKFDQKVLKTKNMRISHQYAENAKSFHLLSYHFTVNNEKERQHFFFNSVKTFVNYV